MALANYNTSANFTDQKILYLFTSTEHPYHKDALDLLSLPAGVTYRFRYDLKYLPVDLQTAEQFNQISKNVILVHVRTTPIAQKKPADILEHFPVREAEIIDLKFMGNFVWVEFLLGDWIKYEINNQYHQSIVNVMPNYQKKELKYTVIIAPKFAYESLKEDLSMPYENSPVIKSWSNLTSLLMKTSEHDNSIFLKFVSLQKIDTQYDSIRQKLKKIGNKIYGFEIEKNASYRIEVLQRAKNNPAPNFDLEIFTNEDEIRPIQKTGKVQGKYDVLDFIFTSENLERSRRSFFIIRPEKDTAKKFTVSRLHFDVDIKVSQSSKVVLVIVLGFGVFLSGIGTALQNPELFTGTVIGAAVGGAMCSIALYLLRR